MKHGCGWLIRVAVALLLPSCTAQIDGVPAGVAAGAQEGMGGGADPLSKVDTAACDEAPWELPLRSMTPSQYRRTLNTLLPGVTPSTSYPASAEGAGFEHYASANESSVAAMRAIIEADEQAAVQAVERLDTLLPCSPEQAGERNCARSFARDFATQAYRRPVTEAELSRLMALYDDAAGASFQERLALLIATVLQAPQFLYLPDYGEPGRGDVWVVDDYALASRLSYLLWDGPPDDVLLRAAGEGELSDPDTRRNQVERMLADAQAEQALGRFGSEWLQLAELERVNKSGERFPGFDALRTSMAEEAERFLQFALVEEGSLKALLTSRDSFIDAPLAELYGVDSESEGAGDFVRARLPEDRRGVLTRSALLSVLAWSEEPSPVHRGKFVRTRLLCQRIPPPPMFAAEVEPGGATVRERAEFLIENERCGTCHSLMDAIGLGLMAYDATGRATSDARADTQGEIHGADDATGPFEGTEELSDLLSSSRTVHACAVKQAMQFTLAHGLRDDENLCARARLNESFYESGGDFHALWRDLIARPSFSKRPLQEMP